MKNIKFKIRNQYVCIKNLNLVFIFAIIAISLFTNQKSHAEILVSDNFNIPGQGYLNTDYDVPGRQSGSLAPIDYEPEYFELSNIGTYAGKCYNNQNANFMSLDYNFNDYKSFVIDFDLDLYTNLPSHYMGISFGKDSEGSGYGSQTGMDVLLGRNLDLSLIVVSEVTNALQFYSHPNLFTAGNMAHNIKLGVSLTAYPPLPSTPCHAVLFIDDVPYPFGSESGSHLFARTLLTNLFNNNYITVAGYTNGPGSPMTIDNYTISSLGDDAVSTESWNNDSDSGINSSMIYTHAISFGDTGNSVINGVPFTGVGADMIGANWKLSTVNFQPLAGPAAASGINVSGASSGLVSNYLESTASTNSGGLILSGLTPGMEYELSLFAIGSQAAGNRKSYFATSAGAPIVLLDQDEFGNGNGQRLVCRYVASVDGTFTFSTTPFSTTTPAWKWFGFCNKAFPPIAPATISATQGTHTDKIVIEWTEVLAANSYNVYRGATANISSTNISWKLTSNFFENTVPEINFAQHYYYWVTTENTVDVSSTTGPALGFTKSEFPPNKPENISPTTMNVVTSPVTLSANSYFSTGGYAFVASQWQLSSESDFSPMKWNSEETLPTETITPPTSKIPDGTNYWRVRYKNDRNTWSEYSDGTSFIFVKGEVKHGIFLDTFNVAGTGDANNGYATSGRQYGSATPLTYTLAAQTEVGNAGNFPRKLLLGLNSGVAPDYSFTDDNHGEFIIEFEADSQTLGAAADWVSLCFGKNDNSDLFPISDFGAGLVFFNNGDFQAFDGKTLAGNGKGVPVGEKLHITLVGSTADFDYSPIKFAAFANGVPMKVNNAKLGYIYEDSNGYDKNFISVFSYNGSNLIDNLKVSKATTNEVRYSRWISDATSLVDAQKDYTHAVNLNGPPISDFNGIAFEGTGYLPVWSYFPNGSSMIKTNDWELFGADGGINFVNASQVSNIITDTDSKELMEHMVFPGDPGAIGIKLYNLTPYSSNTISVYSHGWETAGRTEFFTGTSGGKVTSIDQDTYGRGIGIVFQYDYIASGNGTFTFVASPDAGAGFLVAGFTSEMTGLPEPTFAISLLFSLLSFYIYRIRK